MVFGFWKNKNASAKVDDQEADKIARTYLKTMTITARNKTTFFNQEIHVSPGVSYGTIEYKENTYSFKGYITKPLEFIMSIEAKGKSNPAMLKSQLSSQASLYSRVLQEKRITLLPDQEKAVKNTITLLESLVNSIP